MIEIEVRLFGELRTYLEGLEIGESHALRCEEGSTVKDILSRLGIPVDDVKIILVNGRVKEVDDGLYHGDRLTFFPVVAGG